MKFRYIVILIFFVQFSALAQFELCPVRGEYCGNELKLIWEEGGIVSRDYWVHFGNNDPRNGNYSAFAYSDTLAVIEVDASGLSSVRVILPPEHWCGDIPVVEKCQQTPCDNCPQKILSHDDGKLCVIFEEGSHSVEGLNELPNIEFNFGEGDEKNGTYHGIKVANDTFEFNIPSLLCCDLLDCSITSSLVPVICSYVSNSLVACSPVGGEVRNNPSCLCETVSEECDEEIINYLSSEFIDSRCKHWDGACDIEGHIYIDGMVTINNHEPIPQGYKMVVKGGVIAEKVVVELCEERWCDYVFYDDYEMPTLQQVKRFIKREKHLPGIPSAKEIEEGGVELKSMKLKQQEKIEEIFIHLIDLDERKNLLESKKEALFIENALLLASSHLAK